MSDLTADEQSFLDKAYGCLRNTRFTFTENEALQAAFNEGYDLNILFDARFSRAEPKQGTVPPHYQLTEHTIANNRLINELQAGTWDGRDLETKLAALDREAEQEGVAHPHHIFYPHDPRLFQNRQGAWAVYSERQLTVPFDLQTKLDSLRDGLKKNWLQIGTPLTINRVIEQLKKLGWRDSDRSDAARYVRAWLLGTDQFQRVNQDYWVPKELLPDAVQHTRLQVHPLRASDETTEQSTAAGTEGAADEHDTTAQRKHPTETYQVAGTATKTSVSWTTYLRTANLNEGFLSIPKAMRVIYPLQFPGEGSTNVFRGRWFDDNTMFWIWLDRQHHRLYGPDLLDKLFDQEAGDKLRIEWNEDEIALRSVGHSDEIQQEESRLIDVEELKQLRLDQGENYRQSLQSILTSTPDGLTFYELVRALSERQKHHVSARTVRTLLSSGAFVHRQGRWYAAPGNKVGAMALQVALLDTLVAEYQDQDVVSSPDGIPTDRMRVHAIYRRLTEITRLLRENE